MSADAASEFAGGSDPIDRQSAELHRRARALLAYAAVPETAENYAASVDVIVALNDRRGLTASAEPTSLRRRSAVGDALDRVARDALGAESFTEAEYIDALREAERVTGLSLDDLDNR
jgi:hypothetical protein